MTLQSETSAHVCGAVQHAWLKAHGAALDKPLDSVVLTRIKKLSAMNKLKKAALVVMAQSLSEDEINGLQQLFRSIDADGNGTITIDELRTALSSLNGRLDVRACQGVLHRFTAPSGDQAVIFGVRRIPQHCDAVV